MGMLLSTVSGIAQQHEAYDDCCIYHEGLTKYKSVPLSAGARISLKDPKAIHSIGLAAITPKSKLVPFEFARAPIGDYDVLIDIQYSAICHSDVHAIDGDFSAPGDNSQFPYVAGHEIVGKIHAIGSKVTRHKVGDIVGVGSFKGSCGKCEYCKNGEEQYCPNISLTLNSGGGFSNNIVVPEKFALRIPKGMPLEKVAPLLCAGITTYTPIK